MTGSGKTGLGIVLIEEAALDGIPVLAIDPKGDLSNLLLTFPNLTPGDFAPWVNVGDAAASPSGVESLAAAQADAWKRGLAEWDQGPDRIAALRAAADVRVYTPGSRAGTPLALLKALRPQGSENDEDAAARVSSTATTLLTLAGITEIGPHAREQSLIAAILAAAPPEAGLPWLVEQIQRPSFERIGVLDLETFYPARERQDLALRFNSILAAPGFDVWLSGDPLDIASLLYNPDGRPRISIVSIAHLGDAERMLVVSMLLDAVLDWTRRQTGTSSLRAMIYMDEVFGYLPPVANPPSKLPLLTLLKQARAFGVGVVLATQNPVDLDYKGLSNTGTWFLGKLQTERDKARVLDGIEGVASTLDRQTLDKTLSSLQRRVFLMHNVHERQPVLFETRWTLSYLRGPMTREELRRAQTVAAPADAGPPAGAARPRKTAPPPAPSNRPVLAAGIREVFLPGGPPGAATLTPVLYGAARVQYSDAKRGIDTTADVMATVPFRDGAIPIDWDHATTTDQTPDSLRSDPEAGAPVTYRALPPKALDAKAYAAWARDFEQWVARARPLTLFSARPLKLVSAPGETERDFRIRLQQALREDRDAAVETLRARYAPKVQRLADRVRAAEAALGREQQQSQQQNLQSVVSIGATVLGALMGRKAVSVSTLGRATTAARGVGRSMKESQDIARAGERVREAQAELKALETELDAEASKISATAAEPAGIDTIEIRPKRGAIDVRLLTLAWKAE
jgi:hypothetical protein